MKKYIYIILLLPFISSCWLNVNDEIWASEPIVCDPEMLDFTVDKSKLQLHLSYSGNYTIEFTISVDQPWVSVVDINNGSPITEGLLSKTQSADMMIEIDRKQLVESMNSATISIVADNVIRNVQVSAIGSANIIIKEDKLNFGSSFSQLDMLFCSTIGSRTIKLSTEQEWIKFNSETVYLNENEDSYVKVYCLRENLTVGKHEGSISVVSSGGLFKKNVPVQVYVSEQDELIVNCDDYIFTISSVPYRDENGRVVIKVHLQNCSSYYRAIELNTSKSYAVDGDGKKYSDFAHVSESIKSGESIDLIVELRNVPESVNNFEELYLDFNLTEGVVFKNINF